MSLPLLETKLYAPRRRHGLVPRPRLYERLSRGITSKLTLVSAPAGFGKTTLLVEWLAAIAGAAADGPSVAWLSLDHNDNQPASFWTYVTAALQPVMSGVGASATALLQAPQPPPIETVLGTLLNELSAAPRDVVLVLDDYHVIDARDVQDGMMFLLDHLPPRLHLVIASRADPALQLARLRARGELVEVRAAALRFTPDEAAAYLNEVMGLALTARDVATLEERTEGWIAALQLAALSMQGREDVAGFIAGFAGDDRYIVDYLVEEVLRLQPDRIRRFLLQTAILDRLSAPLCDAVTEQSDGKATLERLDRGNLFVVPLDERRRWYRYHRLFADVLRAHLVDEQPDQVPALHRRASAWYEHNGGHSEAIGHALAAGDYGRAAGLIEYVARATLVSYRPARLLAWLQALPDDVVRARPVLSAYYAFALVGVGELDAAEARLRDAERWVNGTAGGPASAESGPVIVDEAEFRPLGATMALARALRAQILGDIATTRDLARRALDLLPADDHLWRGAAAILLALTHWAEGDLDAAQRVHDRGIASLERAGETALAISAAFDGADLRKARGRLSEAGRLYERALRLAAERGDPALPGVADLYLGLSDLQRERDDLDAAREYLQRAGELSTQAALPQTPARLQVARARMQQIDGDLDGALAFLDQAERLHVRGPVPEVRPVAALRVRVWIAQGRLAAAQEWAEARGLTPQDAPTYPREFEHITLARLLVARGEAQGDHHGVRGALGLLGHLLTEADAHRRTGTAIEILVVQALARRVQGDLAAALERLERALTLAEPEGYVRTFLDEGGAMRDLLRRAAAGNAAAYARRLLAAFEERSRPVAGPPAVVRAGLVEPLTAREVEVMRLVAVGMRNQEIADQLVVTLPTVKRHIANLYGKLGVTHRTEAVARADELGLLERVAGPAQRSSALR